METGYYGKEIIPFLANVTRSAGKTILSYFRGDFGVQIKGGGYSKSDIVTDADRASEDLILEAIQKEFPDHDIITEETSTQLRGSRWKWFIDPLDGTVNFAHGYPVFSVSIALMEGEDLAFGMVYDPLRGECFSAIRNEGAVLNGSPIRVSRTSRLDESLVATGFPYDRATSPDNNLAEFGRVVGRVHGVRRAGSAALDLASVSCGRLDGFWELKLKPWDMAAGMLLVEEAGGRISDRRGGPTDVYTLSVAATNGHIHNELVDVLSPPS
jgi:myo-inositol-1(or 4)-monophosphatase